jgi:chromate transporter
VSDAGLSPSLNSPEYSLSSAVLAPEINFWEAFLFWLKLGFISFGGPAGQISIMHHELVEKRRWISEKRFLHALNFCMVLPGPEAQQLATYLGWLMHKTRGGLVAGLFFIVPSFFLIILLSCLYVTAGQQVWVQAALLGIKPAVTAIVMQAAWRIGSKTIRSTALMFIALTSFIAVRCFDIDFPIIIIGSAILGGGLGRLKPAWIENSSLHKQSNATQTKAIIDDHTPTPLHARFEKIAFIKVALVGFLLALMPIFLLWSKLGQEHTLSQMAVFFIKAALLTFGGAYAVLPYVYHAAVVDFSWLTSAQMMDGLALGETTPGPLIMIVTFVGFMGGYTKAFLGGDHTILSAILAATCVTWFTFLPSFIFIFLGGPVIESSRAQVRFNHALTAITASVVGVIVNLGLFFALQVLWTPSLIPSEPYSWISSLNFRTDFIFLVAFIALFKYKRGVIEVILLSSILGVLFNYLI